jgi:phosphopantothenoylcysteine decarboxylase/phosphopantothenate--cysteine ligase
MTAEAAKLVTPLTFRTLSKNPVITDLFSEELAGISVPHISVTESADLIIIAPATANIIGKMAQGIADDALSTMVMGSKAPKLIAPAMNRNMWDNPVVQENVSKLKNLGCQMIGPETGWLACGDEGIGKMTDVPVIISKATEMIEASKDLKNVRILITAGGTREAIDPVRFIGNRSSGKMGYAVARAAIDRGAHVTLITTPTQIEKPYGCKVIEVETAAQMKQAVTIEAKRSDAVVMAAAVADYRPVQKLKGKMKKLSSKVKIELHKTDDILEALGKNKNKKILIGFSLETGNLIGNSKKKLVNKNLDLVVANTEEAFDSDSSRAYFIYDDGKIERTRLVSKSDIAGKIIDFVAGKFKTQKREGSHLKLLSAASCMQK